MASIPYIPCEEARGLLAEPYALRAHGFDDTAILDICQVTSYHNHVNRPAGGLGVELEARTGHPPAGEAT